MTHLRPQGKSYQDPGEQTLALRLTSTSCLSNCTLLQSPFANKGLAYLSVFMKNNTADVDSFWDLDDPTSSAKETPV